MGLLRRVTLASFGASSWAIGLLACAGASHETAPAPSAETSGSSETASAGTRGYEVHEWGLLRAGPGDVLDVGGVPERVRRVPMAVDKPVLYFHADGEVRVASVGVTSIGGPIREHWPVTSEERMPTEIAWRDLVIDGASPVGGTACTLGGFARAVDRPCTDLDAGEHCESAELRSAIAAGASCVGVGASSAPFLFYRSRTSTFTPPLRVERAGPHDVRATLTGEAPIPGWIVRIHQDGDVFRALAVRPPAPGESIVIGDDFARADAPSDETLPRDARMLPGSTAAGRRAIAETMRELGLTDEEIGAFSRAWDDALFGIAPAQDRGMDDMPVDALRADGDLAPIDSIVYFLPAETCDGVARLTFDPPPRAVRRALAVWARIP